MTNSTTQPAPRFTPGQRVRIIANQGGLYAAQIGVVGVIERKRQYRHWGYHTYDVGYQDAKGRDKCLTSVREDDLEAVEAVADEPAATPTKPAKTPETPETPLFAKGERVTVDPRSALAYASFTRNGAVGVIVGVGTLFRSIRRYDVRYSGTEAAQRAAERDPLHLLPVTQVREEHLLRVEASAEPQPQPPVETAYVERSVERSDGKLVKREQTVLFACARDGKASGCAHTWQVWPDGRYRHCARCKLSERVPATTAAESEVAR